MIPTKLSAAIAADREQSVDIALAEDIGDGDVTAALVGVDEIAEARVIVREPAIICGQPWFELVFAKVDAKVTITWHVEEGEHVDTDQPICELHGSARSILTAERAALNFLQTLSGTATTTHHFVQEVATTGCRLLDTRKTIPGLRTAQKYATAIGGAVNHRIGLYDAILIKENHIASAGGTISAAVSAARNANPGLSVEIEVESLDELRDALDANVERVLLDNFSHQQLREAVALNTAHAHRCELEASGGVERDQLRAIADTGVDYISIGALTKHLRATDFSMRFRFRSASPQSDS
ncbi:MAG: carboxylating nicotinate-nucleotide diphosphorylase [Pseudomonadota bacterium]